eukprot:4751165-Pyramimonas_sp.AAC.1
MLAHARAPWARAAARAAAAPLAHWAFPRAGRASAVFSATAPPDYSCSASSDAGCARSASRAPVLRLAGGAFPVDWGGA